MSELTRVMEEERVRRRVRLRAVALGAGVIALGAAILLCIVEIERLLTFIPLFV